MVISIVKFLAMYYGIVLDAGLEYSHKELKKHFKFLRTCSFKSAANNINLVKTGKLIYVRDSYGVIFPYVCPDIILTNNKECSYTETVEEKSQDDVMILEELADMPTYLVGELLSKYKNKPSFYKVIKKELICRGIYKTKKYKLRKEIIEIELEEGDENDKYQRRREIKYKKS